MRNKKITLLLLLFIVLPGILMAQSTTSLLSQASFGLFDNAFDAAMSVDESGAQPNFSTLESDFFFGGLANFFNISTGSSATGVPVALGYYWGGDKPKSLLGSFLESTSTSTLLNGTTNITTATKTITDATTGAVTDYDWADWTTENQYDFLHSSDFQGSGQILFGLGTMNVGLLLDMSSTQNQSGAAVNTWAANNKTQIDTFLYDSAAADPTLAPDPVVDYTLTTTNTDPDTSTSFFAAIPIFLPVGEDKSLFAQAGFSWDKVDQSSSVTELYSAPADIAAGNFANVATETSQTDVTGSVGLNLDASFSLKLDTDSHKDNRTVIGVTGDLTLNNAEPAVSKTIVQDFTYAGAGAALVLTDLGNTQDDTTTDTRAGSKAWDANLWAQKYLYFDLGDQAVWGIAPVVSAGASMSPAAANYTTESVTVNKIDGDGDGLFTTAADFVITTTTTFAGNDDGGNMDYTVAVNLPASLKFRPNNGPFGVTLGANVGVRYTSRKVEDVPTTSTVVASAVDGTGVALVPPSVTSTPAPASAQTRVTPIWSFTSGNALALNFFLPGGGSIDIVLKGAVWNDRIEIQASIPLK